MLRCFMMMTVLGLTAGLLGCNTMSGVGRDVAMLGQGVAAAPGWSDEVGTKISHEDRQMAELPWPMEPAGMHAQFPGSRPTSAPERTYTVSTEPVEHRAGARAPAAYDSESYKEYYKAYQQFRSLH